MQKVLVISAIFLFLHGCGFSTCITAEHIMDDVIKDIIPTKPDGFDADKIETYWVKSGLSISGSVEGQMIQVTETNINLCNGDVKDLLVSPGAQEVDLGFITTEDDSLKISLNLTSGTFTEDDCFNRNPSVYVANANQCINNNVGRMYAYTLDNSNGPRSNHFFPDRTKKKWVNGKLYALLNNVCQGEGSAAKCDPEFPKEHADLSLVCSGSIPAPGYMDTSTINGKDQGCDNLCGTERSDSSCARAEVVNLDLNNLMDSVYWVQSLDMTYNGKLLAQGTGANPGVRSGGYPHKVGQGDGKVIITLGSATGSGGYNVRIVKDCISGTRDSLYMYISDEAPIMKPGEEGTTKVNFSASDNGTFQIPSGQKGKVYYGVKDNGDGYHNNIGYFSVTAIRQKEAPKFISVGVAYVKDMINIILFGADFQSGAIGIVYNSIVNNMYFLKLVNSLLLLYITLYALFYIFGLFRASTMEVAFMVLKIGLIFRLLQPDSWTFFNEYLFQLFTLAPVELIGMFSGATDASTDFSFLDGTLHRFIMPQTWLQISALIFAGPVGWVFVGTILWGFFMLISCLFEAIVLYFMSIIILAVLLCIAPFFIICILFQRTKSIFDGWIKSLIQTAMQPVVVFSAIALLSQVMMAIIYSLFNFDICSTCIAEVSIDFGALGSLDFCLLDYFLPLGFSPISTIYDNIHDSVNSSSTNFIGIPLPIMDLLMFVVMAHSMKKFVSVSGELAAGLFGSFAHFSHDASRATQGILSVFGMDDQSKAQRAYQSYRAELGGDTGSASSVARPGADRGKDTNYQVARSVSNSSSGGGL